MQLNITLSSKIENISYEISKTLGSPSILNISLSENSTVQNAKEKICEIYNKRLETPAFYREDYTKYIPEHLKLYLFNKELENSSEIKKSTTLRAEICKINKDGESIFSKVKNSVKSFFGY
jgi:hypothetical protein